MEVSGRGYTAATFAGGRTMYATLADGFTQSVAIGDMFTNNRWGPTGLGFGPDGALLVANPTDGHLWRIAPDGTPDAEPVIRNLGAVGLVNLADGRVLATREDGHELAELDLENGTMGRRYASPFGRPVGAALDPTSGRVLITLLAVHALAWLDPESGEWTQAAAGPPLARPDGIAFDAQGNAFIGSVGNDRVVCLSRDGQLSEVAAIGGEPDGIAVAAPSSPLNGAVLVSCHDGSLHRLDRVDGEWQSQVVAHSGSRGDHMAISPDGYLYLTQRDEVLRLGPPIFGPSASA